MSSELDNLKQSIELSNIQASLQPKIKHIKVDSKPKVKVDLADALLAIPEMVTLLRQIVREKRTANDALRIFSDQELTLRKILVKVDSSLRANKLIEKNIYERLEQFNVTEAKYKRIMVKVDSVLDQLEQVLSRELQ